MVPGEGLSYSPDEIGLVTPTKSTCLSFTVSKLKGKVLQAIQEGERLHHDQKPG